MVGPFEGSTQFDIATHTFFLAYIYFSSFLAYI